MGNDNVKDVQSLICQWCSKALRYKEVVKIGHAKGFKIACPVTKSSDLTKCKVMIGLNYSPKRDNGVQPCIDKLESVINLLLVFVFDFSLEAALEFIQNSVVIVDRCPFILEY